MRLIGAPGPGGGKISLSASSSVLFLQSGDRAQKTQEATATKHSRRSFGVRRHGFALWQRNTKIRPRSRAFQ